MRPRPTAAWGGLLAAVVLLHAVALDRLAAPAMPHAKGAARAVLLRLPIASAQAEVVAAPAPAPVPSDAALPSVPTVAAPSVPMPKARVPRKAAAAPAPPARPVAQAAVLEPAAEPAHRTPTDAPPPITQALAQERPAEAPMHVAALEEAAQEPATPATAAPSAATSPPPNERAADRADDGPDMTSVPVYRTRVPASWTASYKLSRSGITGSGEIDWQHDSSHYTLRLEGKVPLFGSLLTQTSRGSFDAAGLAPERFTDKRMRRGEQAANFQRAASKVSFSGQQPDVPLTAGVQDRLSVMLQLAAVANGWAKPPADGTEVLIRVVSARGDVSVWALRFEGVQSVETPAGPVKALRFLRESQSAHGTRAEFWLDPARQYQPVRARFTDGSGDPLELQRLDTAP